MNANTTVICSICGKAADDVAVIYRGANAAICNKCQFQALAALATCSSNKAPPDASQYSSCPFCDRQLNELSRLLIFENVPICTDCLFWAVGDLLSKEGRDKPMILYSA